MTTDPKIILSCQTDRMWCNTIWHHHIFSLRKDTSPLYFLSPAAHSKLLELWSVREVERLRVSFCGQSAGFEGI